MPRSSGSGIVGGLSGAFLSIFYDPIDYLATPLISDKEVSLGRGQKCWRYTLVIMSLIFIVFGSIGIWLGASALERAQSSESRRNHSLYVPVGLIVTGTFIILFSLSGMYGAIRESSKALWIYLMCNILTSTAMLIVAVLLLTASGPDVADDWNNRWSVDFKTHVQERANCCGLFQFMDGNQVGTCPATATDACAPIIISHVKHIYNVAGTVGIGVSVTMLSTLISTLVLAIAFNRKHTYDRIRDVNNNSEFEGISSLSLQDVNPNTFVIGMQDHDQDDEDDNDHLSRNTYK